ncbi:4a-hydroxytetrahydrobiopterin dehydratase [Longivirga aurantiaca]|uniref:Putative pterin-4-alpha-carbinolamine dehydratase n=1 Tax=Longivirga aurantiaca TaxID=1837743 RepID=A0ABW1SZN7_9ACTN
MARLLDDEEIARQLTALPGWVGDGAALHRDYELPDFLTAIRGVDEIAQLAEHMDHHPDIDIRWRTLRITLSTHSEGGTTQLDVELAHQIHEVLARLGAT